jgi:hypothetical protein
MDRTKTQKTTTTDAHHEHPRPILRVLRVVISYGMIFYTIAAALAVCYIIANLVFEGWSRAMNWLTPFIAIYIVLLGYFLSAKEKR